ncbi:MAG: hypothetical protein K2X28_03470 [Alphaproteobacteria bacterium]|nr:hypothetical protein [Alphaproteobacteria bacterium]
MRINQAMPMIPSSPQGQQPSLCLLIIEDQGRAWAVDLWTTEDTKSLKATFTTSKIFDQGGHNEVI